MKEKGNSVRITAYAKGTPDEASIARRISMSRALAVRAFLIREGVDQLKINVQAMGHNVPSGAPDRADVMIR
jgi:outer membrane protein OmpA-like peptidoglycan-associated protein